MKQPQIFSLKTDFCLKRRIKNGFSGDKRQENGFYLPKRKTDFLKYVL